MALYEYYQAATSGPLVIWLMLLFNIASAGLFFLILRKKSFSRGSSAGWGLIIWLVLMLADELVMHLYPWHEDLTKEPGPFLFVLSAVISIPLITAVITYTLIKIRQLLNQSA